MLEDLDLISLSMIKVSIAWETSKSPLGQGLRLIFAGLGGPFLGRASALDNLLHLNNPFCFPYEPIHDPLLLLE
jgi:hypothetical protein